MFKKHFKSNQHGRSMVEMLGVLAIIGMLSLGSVWLYDYASNAYQTNQIQKTVLTAKTMSEVNISPSHSKEVNRYVEKTLPQYQSDSDMVELSDAIDKYVITIHEVSEKIQNMVLNQADTYAYHNISVEQLENNTLQFTFDGHLCVVPKTWNGSECVCPNDYEYGDKCESCPPPREWSTRGHMCHCPDPSMPIWHNDDCVECATNADCDLSRPVCNEYNSCEPCPADKPNYNTIKQECGTCPDKLFWNGTECSVNECENNNDCFEKYDETYFCSRGGNPCETTEFTGAVCQKLNFKQFELNGVNFYVSTDNYNKGSQGWETSINFCLALDKQMVSVSDLHCANEVKIGSSQRSCKNDEYATHDTLREKLRNIGIKYAPWIAFDAWTTSGPSTCNKTCMPTTEDRLNTHQSASTKIHGGAHYVLCRDWGPMCYGDTKRVGDECVPTCTTSDDCPIDRPRCNTTAQLCETCPSGTYWHTEKKECVNCLNNTHCSGSTPVCNADNMCETCPNSAPIWNMAEQKCITCEESNSGKPYWNGSQCVSCLENTHCSGSTPICNTSNTCEACPSSKPVWNASQKQCITCAESNSTTPSWNGSQCVSCYAANNTKPYWNGTTCSKCPSTKPKWNTSTQVCEACPSNRPQYNASTNTCGCPDGGTVVNGVCTIVLRSDGGFDACPWGPAPGCIPVVSKFGPYQYNYKVYVDGYVDDYLKFYVNSTNMPGTAIYNDWCSWIDGTVVKEVGYDHYWSNELMGTLTAGNHGGLLAYSSSGCCYWKSPGKVWLELAP